MDSEKIIYVKLTNACNLKCKHCYNAQMENSDEMPDEILAKALRFIRATALMQSPHFVDVQLHGGEPMLYDIGKLNAFIDEFPENVRTSITTNLAYRLTNDKIDFFKKMLPYDDKPFIMTSWDCGIRFTKRQEATWKKNVTALVEEGITVQPIVCVTKKLIDKSPSEIFEMFKEIGVDHVNFERLTLTGNAKDGELKPTNREIDDWLFDAYVEAQNAGVKVPLFEQIENSVNGFLTGCRARKCMQNVMTINPDGTVSACPNTACFWFAKLNDIGGLDMCKKRNKAYLDGIESHRKFDCYLCKLFKYCNGDCCQLQHDETGCPGLKKIYEYLVENRKTTT